MSCCKDPMSLPSHRAEVAAVVKTVRRPPGKHFSYGTAGFRGPATTLESTFLRVGMIATLRAHQTRKTIGVMITASHNPAPDNGVKIVDQDGGMLIQRYEAYAQDLANVSYTEVPGLLDKIAATERISLSDTPVDVYVGRDTRESSEHLCKLVKEGAEAMGAKIRDWGLCTTPELHHIVRMTNLGGDYLKWASNEGYFEMLGDAYRKILKGASTKDRGPVVVDAACGIGALKLAGLNAAVGDLLEIKGRNGVGEGELNHKVGAEHCQKQRLPPQNFSPEKDRLVRCASLDGDADRLVYHYFDGTGKWCLLDGDAIATLIAQFLSDQFSAMGLKIADPEGKTEEGAISVGIVQTAYANGASGKYIRDVLKLPVGMAKTGVKYVHHKALEYGIGVYFEANGHGTVVFNDAVMDRLRKVDPSTLTADGKVALERLLAAYQLINQAVGDALSDMLVVEAILTLKGWKLTDWDCMYDDLPSRQTKLAVKDRKIVKPIADETRITEPVALQEAIDKLASGYRMGRAFVRPSGTEDVVRVYAEASTRAQADKLAYEVAMAAYEIAGGVGSKPAPFS